MRSEPGKTHRAWRMTLTVLALSNALTALTITIQRPSPAFCGGRLSAGFPAAVICDATGESPLASVGKIDEADLDSPSLPGAIVDITVYAVLFWGAWRVADRVGPRVN